jgi:hypothetical protein
VSYIPIARTFSDSNMCTPINTHVLVERSPDINIAAIRQSPALAVGRYAVEARAPAAAKSISLRRRPNRSSRLRMDSPLRPAAIAGPLRSTPPIAERSSTTRSTASQ